MSCTGDKISGHANKVAGKAKELAGKATGNEKLAIRARSKCR